MPSQKEFHEQLPASCPPSHANDTALDAVYRLVAKSTPTENCFSSYAKLGGHKPFKVDECSWSSCSLFSDKSVALDMFKLPNIRRRFSHVATLDIPAGSGKHSRRDAHIDFWRYAEFDICATVQAVEQVP